MRLEEVMRRLDELRGASPSGAWDLFTTTETALETYYARGEELNAQAYETLKRVVFDGLMSGLEVAHPELLPALTCEHPVGYGNVMELFDGGGAIEEIMTLDPEKFADAFWSETVMQGQVGVTVWHNDYLETKWPQALGNAKSKERAGLELMESYCLVRYESWTLPLIFEELGRRHQRWTEDRRAFAKHIYIDRGWRELIETYGLSVYEPSYAGELNEDDD